MTKITRDVSGSDETYVLDYTKRARREGYEIQGLPDGYMGRMFFSGDREEVGLHLGTNLYEADGLNSNQVEAILSIARHAASDLGAENLKVHKEALDEFPATELTIFNGVRVHHMTVPMTFDEVASLAKTQGSITIKQDRDTSVPVVIPDIDDPVFLESVDHKRGERGVLSRFGSTGISENRDFSNLHLDQGHYVIHVDEEFHDGFKFPVMNDENGNLLIAINLKNDFYTDSNLRLMQPLNEDFIRNMPTNTRIMAPEIVWLEEFAEVSNRIHDRSMVSADISEQEKNKIKDKTTYIDSIRKQIERNPDFNPVHELKKVGNLIRDGHAHKLKTKYALPEDYETFMIQHELKSNGFGHLAEKYPNLHFIRATLDSPEQMKDFETTHKKLREDSVHMDHENGNAMEPGL